MEALQAQPMRNSGQDRFHGSPEPTSEASGSLRGERELRKRQSKGARHAWCLRTPYFLSRERVSEKLAFQQNRCALVKTSPKLDVSPPFVQTILPAFSRQFR